MKLEIGAGKSPKQGFIHLDKFPMPHIEIIADAWDTGLDSESVEEIYARHFFEHMTPAEATLALFEWNRILIPGGTLELVMPNLEYHAKQLLLPGKSPIVGTSNFEHAMAGFYGWLHKGVGMAHKWGYTKTSLTKKLLEVYYKVTVTIERECDLHAIVIK